MTCRIEVVDRVGSSIPTAPVVELVEAVLCGEGRTGAVSVALIDEVAMSVLNRRYRDQDGPTDVLTFSEVPGEGWWPEIGKDDPGAEDLALCPTLGEMVICPSVVLRYADEEGTSPGYQLGWTLIHGSLHLLGYDHEIDKGEMRARERLLLERYAGMLQRLSFSQEL